MTCMSSSLALEGEGLQGEKTIYFPNDIVDTQNFPSIQS